MLARAVLTDPETMLDRLVRGRIAVGLTACVATRCCMKPCCYRQGLLALQLHGTGVATRGNCVQIFTDAGTGGHGRL